MLELSVIKSFIKDRGVFEEYYPKLKDLVLEKEIKTILTTISKYYRKYDNHYYISIDELAGYFKLQYPNAKNKELYDQIFKQVSELGTSDSLATDLIHCLIEKDRANKIVQKLLPIVQGQEFGKLSTVKEDIDSFEQLIGDLENDEEEEEYFVTQDLDVLTAAESLDAGYRWPLAELQKVLGNISGGMLGHVFMPPDTGKTTFVINTLRYVVRQFQNEEDYALWVNNEEAGKYLNLRLYSGVCGTTIQQIMGDKARARELFLKYQGDRILLRDQASTSILDIEHLLAKYNPKLIVVDIGDKIKLPTAGNSPQHERLKELYIRYRELAKGYDTHFLTTGQASATAYTKRWLAKEDMDNSKVGKPGELDYAIGGTGEDKNPNLRYLAVCKNKRGPYNKFTAGFHPEKARYSDV